MIRVFTKTNGTSYTMNIWEVAFVVTLSIIFFVDWITTSTDTQYVMLKDYRFGIA